MFVRFQRSWELIKASMSVLRADKELLVFPIISSIALLIVSAAFLVPTVAAGFFDSMFESGGILGYIVLFAFYVVQYTVIFFSNSALIGAAMIRLRGGDPTIGDGLRIAREHLQAILGYALISATVGVLLRILSERGGFVASLLSMLGGLAWNLATFLVVPILVVEGVGPMEAIQRSAALLKRTWGEQIVGGFSLGLIFVPLFILLFIIGLVVVIPMLTIGAPVALVIALALIFVLAFVGLGLLQSTLHGIFVAALYHYAADGEVGDFYNPELIKQAFTPKRR